MQFNKMLPIQQETHFDRKLAKAIDAHNAELARLDAVEVGIPERKRDLAARVLSGAINGKEALAELRAINDLAFSVEIDRRPLLAERARLSPMVNEAHAKESTRLRGAADKRRDEIKAKLDASGLNLLPAEVGAAIQRDGEYMAADQRSRSLFVKSHSGTMHPDVIGGWDSAFERFVHQHFGKPGTPAPTRTVEVVPHGTGG